MAPGAKVVKAFNTIFAAVMHSSSSTFGPQKATGFYCGDDGSAKAVVSGLIRETGLKPLDVISKKGMIVWTFNPMPYQNWLLYFSHTSLQSD